MRRVIMVALIAILFCLPMVSIGCGNGIDKDAIATTIWYVALDAVEDYIYREIGVDIEDKESVTGWAIDKVHSYDPESKLTKYVNVDVITGDAYTFVWELIEKIPDWMSGADPDIYTTVNRDMPTPGVVRERLSDKTVFLK